MSKELHVKIDENHGLYSLLCAVDRELILFPQRTFVFGCFDILVGQSIENVGYTIWDAEVLLAYFLFDIRDELLVTGKSVLELGAGLAYEYDIHANYFSPPIIRNSFSGDNML